MDKPTKESIEETKEKDSAVKPVETYFPFDKENTDKDIPSDKKGAEEGGQDEKQETNEQSEPKPEPKQEGKGEEENAEEFDIPKQFIVKDEAGNIDWKASAKKAYDSWANANKEIGRKGQQLGDERKTAEELREELEKMRAEITSKKQDLKLNGEGEEDLTKDELYELLENDPKSLIDKIKKGVLNDITKQRMEDIRRKRQEGEIFAKEVDLFFADNAGAKEYEKEMFEMFLALPDKEKSEAVKYPHIAMKNLLLEVQLKKNKDMLEKAAYKPEPPKEEKGGVASASTVRKNSVYSKLTPEEREWAEGFGLTEAEVEQAINKGK